MTHRPFRLLAAVIVSAVMAGAAAPVLAQPAPPAGTPYPDVVRQNFMRGCQVKAPEAFCRCMLQEIETRYALDQFISFDQALAAGKEHPMKEEIRAFVPGCAATVSS